MIVVSDTSPLNYLVLIDLQHILPELFERILIPSAVRDELQSAGASEAIARFMAATPAWLEIRQVSNVDPKLHNLDRGEREAITLAASLSVGSVLIDERKGRLAARERRITMPNALDTFRAQREAADQVYGRLTEITDLLARLRTQVDAVTANADLRALLRQEQSWLERLQVAITEVRNFREQERQRFWPGVWRRWALALGFALASAAAAGAGYVWAIRPDAVELAELRSRVQLADAIARRTMTMSPAERQRFDTFMQWNVPARK